MIKSGITQDEVISWGGEDVFNKALPIVTSGDVHDVTYNDETLEIRGKIEQPSGWEMPVSFFLKPGGRIESHCPCDTNRRFGMVCQHVVAVGYALVVSEMDDIEEEKPRGAREEEPDEPQEEEDFIEVETKPKFSAFVAGSRASLSIEIDAHYGEIEFPVCSVQRSARCRVRGRSTFPIPTIRLCGA